MKKNKICCIFNFASHYRSSIYELMDKELSCDFYFSNKAKTPNLKKMDYNLLGNFKKELEFFNLFGNFSWVDGMVSLVFKPYKHYFLVGEPYCLSTWIFLILAKFLN